VGVQTVTRSGAAAAVTPELWWVVLCGGCGILWRSVTKRFEPETAPGVRNAGNSSRGYEMFYSVPSTAVVGRIRILNAGVAHCSHSLCG